MAEAACLNGTSNHRSAACIQEPTTALHIGISIRAIPVQVCAPRQGPDRSEPCAAVNGPRRSPLSHGQAAPVHQVHQPTPSTGDLAHG